MFHCSSSLSFPFHSFHMVQINISNLPQTCCIIWLLLMSYKLIYMSHDWWRMCSDIFIILILGGRYTTSCIYYLGSLSAQRSIRDSFSEMFFTGMGSALTLFDIYFIVSGLFRGESAASRLWAWLMLLLTYSRDNSLRFMWLSNQCWW